MRHPAKHLVLFTLIWLSGAAGLDARSKTDLVILENSDTIHGEIKGLSRGVLSLKTDWMGTLQIEWIHVREIRSDYFFEVTLTDGRRRLGSLRPGSEEGQLEVVAQGYSTQEQNIRVVGITPIEKTFLNRIKFSVELGTSYYSSNASKQLSFGTDFKYRTEKYGATADYDMIYRQQKKAPETDRNELRTSFERYYGNNWSVIAITQFLHSRELDLDLRSLLGGGVTKELIKTNRTILTVLGGMAYNREVYVGEPVKNSIEGLSGIGFQAFRFDKPEFDVTTSFNAIPSFSDWGRIRLTMNAGLRFKLFRDLHWNASLFENYDSRPPEGSQKNDFGVQTTFGWTFN